MFALNVTREVNFCLLCTWNKDPIFILQLGSCARTNFSKVEKNKNAGKNSCRPDLRMTCKDEVESIWICLQSEHFASGAVFREGWMIKLQIKIKKRLNKALCCRSEQHPPIELLFSLLPLWQILAAMVTINRSECLTGSINVQINL